MMMMIQSNGCFMRIITQLEILLLLLLTFNITTTLGQELPSINIPIYSDVSNQTYRQNVCDRQRLFANGEIELRDALNGLQLNVALRYGGNFFYLDESTGGAIREDYPGLVAVLMDELATRAGFTWRDSFGAFPGPTLGSNQTWTDMLLWATDNFDVSVDFWARTLDRLSSGVVYPEGWYNYDYILVGIDKGTQGVNIWGFLEPFAPAVWVMIVVTVVFSGCLYFVLEEFMGTNPNQAARPKTETWGNDVVLSFLLFTQHFQFQPRTNPSRVVAASLALWALLMSSTYTANLASFFVVETKTSFDIDSIEEAVAANMPLCVWESTASAIYVETTFPQATLIKKDSDLDLYEGLQKGECVLAVVAYSSFQEFRNDKRANPTCDLQWIGRYIKHEPAAFGIKSDAGTKCTSLIYNVLNLHLVEMKLDQFIKQAWDEHLLRSQDINCVAAQKEEETSRQRTLAEMAGMFIVHAIGSGIAILITLKTKLCSLCKKSYQGSKGVTASSPKRRTRGNDTSDPSTYHGPTEDPTFRHTPNNDPANSAMITLATEKEEDGEIVSGYIKGAQEMGQTLKRRQDAMEAKLQRQLQQIVDHLKQHKSGDIDGIGVLGSCRQTPR